MRQVMQAKISLNTANRVQINMNLKYEKGDVSRHLSQHPPSVIWKSHQHTNEHSHVQY